MAEKRSRRGGPVRLVSFAHGGLATYPPGATFGPRRMWEFEFVWLIAGDGRYVVDGVVHAAPQGSFVLCQPETVDEFIWDPKRRTRHGYFHFQMPEKSPGFGRRGEWPVVAQRPQNELLEPLFRFVIGHAHRGEKRAIEHAIELMLHIFISGPRAAPSLEIDPPPEPVSRATAHIYQTLDEDPSAVISLDDLAAAACVTAEHLCRLFKKTTGRSPMAAARLARLDRAATLLTRTNFSIGQIAGLCGFASQFHFSRLFKSAFGAAPAEVRRRVRGGEIPPLPSLIELGRTVPDQN